MNRRWSYLVVYLVLAAIITVGLGSLNVPPYLALSEHAVQTNAVVAQTTCDVHDTLDYRFHANGRDFEGHGLAEGDCASVHRGDRVMVWYLPDRPEVSTLQAPQGALENELVSVALAATVPPAILVLSNAFRHRRRRRQRAST